MRPAEVAKPLGVFVAVVVVVLAGTAVASLATGSESVPPADGQNVSGQSPPQFQPAAVNPTVDPETGDLDVDAAEGTKRVLVDTQHGNQFDRAELEPVVEALAEAGHHVDFVGGSTGDGLAQGDYNATLQRYDAVLVVAPTASFTKGERIALQQYADGGGRVVVLAEPTQMVVSGGGLVASATRVSFGANGLTQSFGVRIGAEALYNIDDERNDNNFRSVNAEPTADGALTDGVETITFDYAGYAVTTGDADADVLFAAVDGTRTLESRRTGTFPTVVRNGSVVFVSDSDFVTASELYDADNEVFVSNLLDFLVSGDKADDVPPTPGAGSGDG